MPKVKYQVKLPVGSYNHEATAVGYAPLNKFNVVLISRNSQQIDFEPNEETGTIASATTPNSVQKLTIQEIKNNPGGNFDLSRDIQVWPGVTLGLVVEF